MEQVIDAPRLVMDAASGRVGETAFHRLVDLAGQHRSRLLRPLGRGDKDGVNRVAGQILGQIARLLVPHVAEQA